MTMERIEINNPIWGWKDSNTFCLCFDGGIDKDGDSFFYCCEYWKDVDRWIMERIYEDDYTDAFFTAPEKLYIIAIMESLMKNKEGGIDQ